MSQEVGVIKKSWKNIVTGITCAVVGAGVMFGADTARLHDTITKAEAKQAILAAATYSAETAVASVKGITTAGSRQEAVANAVKAVESAIPQFIEAAQTVKEAVKETATELTTTVKNEVKEVKEVVSGEKKVTTEKKEKVADSDKTATTKVKDVVKDTKANK